jgi:SAM-dependent methyltransferase
MFDRHSKLLTITEFLKGVLHHILANGQTVRWVTQEPILAEMIDDSGEIHLAVDIGCGGGIYAIELLAPKADRIIAFDYNWHHAWLTRERARREGLKRLHVLVASAEALPFKGDVADLLLCSEVLEHLSQDRLAVSEFARVIRPTNGKLVLSVPYPPEPFSNPEHAREGYTEPEIRLLLETSGFVIEERKFCMFTLTRLVLRAYAFLRIPLPLLFFCRIEHLLSRVIPFSNPYDMVVRARYQKDQ